MNLEAERAVLGAILRRNSGLDVALEILEPGDFILDQHRRIFGAMMRFLERRDTTVAAGKEAGLCIDTITLSNELRRTGELETAGGVPYIEQIQDGVPGVTNVAHYARIVKEKAALRTIVHVSQSVQQQAMEATEGAGEILERGQSLLSEIIEGMERGMEGSGPISVRDVVKSSMPMFSKLEEGGGMFGNRTGYSWLDRTLSGWVPSEFVLLAARPSKGKSAFMLELVCRLASRGEPVCLFSLEMQKASLILRMACLLARVDSHKLRNGFCNKEEWGSLTGALATMQEWNLWIDDRAGLRSTEIRRRAVSLARRHRIRFCAIDYLQIVRAAKDIPDTRERVSNVSMEFQRLARDLGEISHCALFSCCQLSRQADKRIPQLSDLAESGQLERDADTVIFLYDEKDDDDTRLAEPGRPITKVLHVAKQRNGPLEYKRFIMYPTWGGFEEKGREQDEPPAYLLARSGREDEAWLTQTQ